MKAFLSGLGLGLIVGVVIAPDKGEATRRRLAEAARENFDSAGEQLNDLRDRAVEQVSEIRDRAVELRDRAQQGAEHIARKAQRQYESVVKAGLLEILNDWSEERLIEINGIGPVLASKIIQNRPYKQESDLTDSKILPPSAIEAIRKAS